MIRKCPERFSGIVKTKFLNLSRNIEPFARFERSNLLAQAPICSIIPDDGHEALGLTGITRGFLQGTKVGSNNASPHWFLPIIGGLTDWWAPYSGVKVTPDGIPIRMNRASW